MSVPGPGPGTPKVAANAAVVEGFFGFMWFGWGQQSPPSWLVPLLAAGAGACLVLTVVAVLRTRRLRDLPSPLAQPRARRRYWTLVGTELVLAGAGAAVLGASGRAPLVAGWVCAVVGAHFWPLAAVFPAIGMRPLSVLVLLVGVAAMAWSAVGGPDSSTVAGVGAGVCLLAHGIGVLLLRGRPRVRS